MAKMHTVDDGQSYPFTSASLTPHEGGTIPAIPQFPKSSVSVNNSHRKPGKIFPVLSKHRMATGWLDNYYASWWLVWLMATLGAVLLEISSLDKLWLPFPLFRSQAPSQWVSESYLPSVYLRAHTFEPIQHVSGEWRWHCVPAPWGNFEIQLLLAKAEQWHWKGASGHCGKPAFQCRAF